MIEAIKNLPDISFIDEKTLDQIEAEMVSDYESKFKEVTGTAVSLKDGEPMSLLVYACAVQFYQMHLNTDKAGKMNFLKYAYGSYLDHQGVFKGVTREGEAEAICTVRFSLSAVRAVATAIPAETRVTTMAADVYFATDEYMEIPAGEEYTDVLCTAQTAGKSWNGLAPGELCILVDPIPYVATAQNVSETSGGTDTESDDSMKERIYLAPAGYSVAGPEAALEYFTRKAYTDIGDVKVTTPAECEVKIIVIGKNGELLSNDVMRSIEDYLKEEPVKPMTDRVTVAAPTAENLNVNFTYYINRSEASRAEEIQAKVRTAAEDYIKWQCSKIGRDIEPGKLIEYVMAAGAKRVTVSSPVYTQLEDDAIAVSDGNPGISYGGLEYD